MIFDWISIENFRQFKDVKLQFATKPNAISLVIGHNGMGKTTLLEAFKFCFYGESPNYLKLPQPEELLNYSVKEELNNDDTARLAVRIHFTNDKMSYIASRTATFRKSSNQVVQEGKSKLELLLEDDSGYSRVDDPQTTLDIIMPPGLASIFMFDGERVEESLTSSRIRMKTAVEGALGLERLKHAKKLIGNESLRSTVRGKVEALLRTQTDEESQLLRAVKKSQERIIDIDRELEINNISLGQLKDNIAKAQVAQSAQIELHSLLEKQARFDAQIQQKKMTIQSQVKEGIQLEAKLLLHLELKRNRNTYMSFTRAAKDKGDVFKSLHKDVIQAILKKHECICGRPLEPDSPEAQRLLSLPVLPSDNSTYLTSMQDLLNRSEDYKVLFNRITRLRQSTALNSNEIENLETQKDEVSREIERREREKNSDSLQWDLDNLKRQQGNLKRSMATLEIERKDQQRVVDSSDARMTKIKRNNVYNEKVSKALEDLASISQNLDARLRVQHKLAREMLGDEMDQIVGTLMEGNLSVKISDNYDINVEKTINIGRTSTVINETPTLSTGQNIMVSLAYLRALITTVKQNDTYVTDNKYGLVMDAPLSKLDERHIHLLSENILTRFDQLLFLSFKGQLRDELISGIRGHVKVVYTMAKDDAGNVSFTELPLNELDNYIRTEER